MLLFLHTDLFLNCYGSCRTSMWSMQNCRRMLHWVCIYVFSFPFCSQVLPTLTNKQGANLLREFVVMWSNYKLMARWLCRFFEYLDRFFIPQHIELESLNGISFSCFRDLVGDNCLFLGHLPEFFFLSNLCVLSSMKNCWSNCYSFWSNINFRSSTNYIVDSLRQHWLW